MDPVILQPGEGERLAVAPAEAVVKAIRETTGGPFSMTETTPPAGSPGPVPRAWEDYLRELASDPPGG